MKPTQFKKGHKVHHSEETKLKMKPTQFKKGHKINVGKKMPIFGVKKAVESRKLNNGYQSLINTTRKRMLGKKYEEIYGLEKTKELKEKRKLQILPIKDTLIEVKIQNYLKKLNIEFYTHQYMHIEHGYQCDIFLPIQNNIFQKTIIECDGDYWHGNPLLYKEEELNEKQKQQKERDIIRTKELIEKGYKVLRLWENKIKQIDLEELKEVVFI
jgi:G:T-mismatch repair DNA endonuclease (very short patch repair protein)